MDFCFPFKLSSSQQSGSCALESWEEGYDSAGYDSPWLYTCSPTLASIPAWPLGACYPLHFRDQFYWQSLVPPSSVLLLVTEADQQSVIEPWAPGTALEGGTGAWLPTLMFTMGLLKFQGILACVKMSLLYSFDQQSNIKPVPRLGPSGKPKKLDH